MNKIKSILVAITIVAYRRIVMGDSISLRFVRGLIKSPAVCRASWLQQASPAYAMAFTFADADSDDGLQLAAYHSARDVAETLVDFTVAREGVLHVEYTLLVSTDEVEAAILRGEVITFGDLYCDCISDYRPFDIIRL